jgi:hypothetical protein
MEQLQIECQTACTSGASRQELSQIVSCFRAAEILAACLAGHGSFSQEF